MTRNRFYSTVVPLVGLAYVIVLVAAGGGKVAVIGALVVALIVLAGTLLLPAPEDGRQRNRDRSRRR